MAKIAELETKLYEKELAGSDLIQAVHCECPVVHGVLLCRQQAIPALHSTLCCQHQQLHAMSTS
jgi:hypothetical protein